MPYRTILETEHHQLPVHHCLISFPRNPQALIIITVSPSHQSLHLYSRPPSTALSPPFLGPLPRLRHPIPPPIPPPPALASLPLRSRSPTHSRPAAPCSPAHAHYL